MNYSNDSRIVMTLDAGGTNFVFKAVQAEEEILDPICLSANGDSLELVLKSIIEGFNLVKSKLVHKAVDTHQKPVPLTKQPVAISFAFPGPADYENGIIGDLQNLPFFRGGVALGPMLREKFGIPVFINNDGDLFAYGEAIAGLLPGINKKLEELGNPKRYHNLFGVTFGTGFGGGIVTRNGLHIGDNSSGGEINRMRNRTFKNWDTEESVSIRGIKREYANNTGLNMKSCPEPKDICEIGMGKMKGNRQAAIQAFDAFARDAADAVANAITLIDGLVVIGGGLSGAWPLFLPKLVEDMNHPFETMSGKPLERLETVAYNLEDPIDYGNFLTSTSKVIPVPFSENMVNFDPEKKIGVGISKLGTSKAVSIGAYAFALNML
ncbi:MAG: ROK family protein [Bacteroidales bacterium]|nr:ROK family protein [Bacteroidales bacterium]